MIRIGWKCRRTRTKLTMVCDAYCIQELIDLLADFTTRPSTDGSWFVPVSFFCDDFDPDRDLAPATMSSHREDGFTPRFVVANIPDVSEPRADEQGKNIHLPS